MVEKLSCGRWMKIFRWQIFWLRLEVSFGCLRGDGGHLPNFRPRGWRFSALHHAAALEGGQVPQSTWVFQGKILGRTFPPQLDVKKKGLSHIFFCRVLSPRSWAYLRIAWRHRGIWSWCTGPSFFKLSHRSWWWTTAWYHPQLGSLVAELSHASHAHELRLVGFFMWAVWASSLATCQNAKKCLNDDLRCTDITRHKKNSGIPNWIETYLVLERTGFMQYMFLGKKSRFQLQRTPVQV